MVKIIDYLLIFRVCRFMVAKCFWLIFDKIIEDQVCVVSKEGQFVSSTVAGKSSCPIDYTVPNGTLYYRLTTTFTKRHFWHFRMRFGGL